MLDHAPPADRPRVDGGADGDQPPPRAQPGGSDLEVDTDFADLFEVKDGAVAEREVRFDHDERTLTLAYERAGFQRSLTISASRPAAVTREGFAYPLALAPGEQWSTTFILTPYAAQPGIAFTHREPRGALAKLSAAKSTELEQWLAGRQRCGRRTRR